MQFYYGDIDRYDSGSFWITQPDEWDEDDDGPFPGEPVVGFSTDGGVDGMVRLRDLLKALGAVLK